MIFHKKKVLVLGAGETGISMVKWLSYLGAHLSLADSRPNPPSQSLLDDFVPPQKDFLVILILNYSRMLMQLQLALEFR